VRLAQFAQGEALARTAGTGIDQSSPITDSTMGGTHSQCSSLLVRFSWLAPYSPSQSATVRMASDAISLAAEITGSDFGAH
jgi:hypothetical protein